MAEIRKYNPAAGNAIAQALRAAMGEPVRPTEPGSRPTEPGSRPTSPTPQTAPPATTTAWLQVHVQPADED